MKNIFKILIGVLLVIFLSSCEMDKNNIVLIDVKDMGSIKIELYPYDAPETVENFKNLVKDKFYDGLTFHRVINGFMIQTGDPTASGSGGSEKTIKGEFQENGFNNKISHVRGVVSMARRGSNPETIETMNSASSQFFIVQEDSTFLDGKYAAFGRVIDGLDIIDKIASVETDEDDKPLEDIIINSISFYEGDK